VVNIRLPLQRESSSGLYKESSSGAMEDMQDYLARMNKQLAEMEAAHQQVLCWCGSTPAGTLTPAASEPNPPLNQQCSSVAVTVLHHVCVALRACASLDTPHTTYQPTLDAYECTTLHPPLSSHVLLW
jgi:hypothetical protein